MNPDEFEQQMRRGECFHDLRLIPDAWAIVRVDGHSFSRFTAARFDKPFDEKFRDAMVVTASALMEQLQGIYAYTESDEISLLLPKTYDLFDREVEKLVSLSAGIASAAFTHAINEPAHFDSRLWVGATSDAVRDYFRWRQSDATRCCLNGWCYWTLRNEGKDVKEATTTLEKKSVGWKNEFLFQRGQNFNDVPLWQRRGIGIYWEDYEKMGLNPITGQTVPAIRRRLHTDLELPMKEEYDQFLARFLT